MLVPDAEGGLFGHISGLSGFVLVVVAGKDIIIYDFVDAVHRVRLITWVPIRLKGLSDVDRILRLDRDVWFELVVYHFSNLVR